MRQRPGRPLEPLQQHNKRTECLLLQVIHASRHWAKTSVSCEKEASRLQAALTANTEDLEAARAYLADAKVHLAELEEKVANKQSLMATAVAEPPPLATDSEDSESEELMGREEELNLRPGKLLVMAILQLSCSFLGYTSRSSASHIRMRSCSLLARSFCLEMSSFLKQWNSCQRPCIFPTNG